MTKRHRKTHFTITANGNSGDDGAGLVAAFTDAVGAVAQGPVNYFVTITASCNVGADDPQAVYDAAIAGLSGFPDVAVGVDPPIA